MRPFSFYYNTIIKEAAEPELPADEESSTASEDTSKRGWTPEKVEGLIALVKGKLKQANPYFWHLLKSMPVLIVDPKTSDIKTAAVDQYRNLYFNPVFVQQILEHYNASEDNKVTGTDPFTYLVAHEIYHVVNRTFERQKDRDIMLVDKDGNPGSSLWNIATDFEMNDELSWRWGITPPIINGQPVGCLTDKDGNAFFNNKQYNFRNKPAERIYAELAKDIPEGEGKGRKRRPGDGNIGIGDIVKEKGTDVFGEVVDIKGGEAVIKQISKEEAYKKAKQRS